MYDDVCTVVINDSTQYKINIAIMIKGGSNDKMTNLEICVGVHDLKHNTHIEYIKNYFGTTQCSAEKYSRSKNSAADGHSPFPSHSSSASSSLLRYYHRCK